MINRHKGNHSIITKEDQYYDGFELGSFDERYVSSWMTEGTNDCIKYIEDTMDREYEYYRYQALLLKKDQTEEN